MKTNAIIGEFEIGEVITIFLTNGLKEEGILIGIAENSIKIKTPTKTLTIFEDIIGGWAKYEPNEIFKKKNTANDIDNSMDEKNASQLATITIEEILNVPQLDILETELMDEPLEVLPSEFEGKKETAIDEKPLNEFLPFEIEQIPWKEDGLPEEDMFKGRDELLEDLVRHYRSTERKKTYVLYGLTRTGKSSILRYFSDVILNKEIKIDRIYKFIPFLWDLSRAAAQSNAKDMWNYLLQKSTADKINTYRTKGQVALPENNLLHLTEYRIKHLNEFIEYLKTNGYFPIFLIDEFSYYKELNKTGKVDASFIANFRQISYSNLACFVYAGTYNLRRLVSDPTMSITGQFANTIEFEIGQIDVESAIELILAFGEKVKFEEDAVHQILQLSNRIPYFIQIICKNVAFYCYENRINRVNSNILEEVVKILVGDKPKKRGSYIQKISDGAFGNNQYDPTDTKGMVLLSSICFLRQESEFIDGVGYSEIATLWANNGLKNPNQILHETMEDLIEKGILLKKNNKDFPVYNIGVDLFRRWWQNEKSSDIKMEVSKLLEI